jgi:hypothetical protein
MRWTGTSCLLAAALAAGAPVGAQAPAGRPVVEAASQLPRKTYVLPRKPSEMLADPAAVAALAREVDADLAAITGQYEIRDRSTLTDFYTLRMQIALLQRRYSDAVEWAEKIALLQDKPAQRATAGLLAYGYAAAGRTGLSPQARREAFQGAVAARLEAMPAAPVQARVREIRRNYQLMSTGYFTGGVQAEVDPIWQKSPVVGREIAADVIRTHLALARTLEYRDSMLAALGGWLAKHGSTAPMADVWTARSLVLPVEGSLTPVTIAIWDSGVDPQVYRSRLVANAGEAANGKDDDGNGIVDDLFGLSYSLDYRREAGPLRPIPAVAEGRLEELQSFITGLSDLQAAIDSPEADALRMKIAALSPAEVGTFLEGLNFYSGYIHGTHVASIAVDGNPAARLLPVRLTFNFTNVPRAFTETEAAGLVRMARESIAYMKTHGTRLANMSWGYTARDIERSLEANNVESDPEKRKLRAQAIFDLIFDGMSGAMRTAPEILFVIAAGNSDEDINFVRDMPGGIDLPNVLSVGASDMSGAATSFTSMGKSVDLYANGYAVDGVLPGGNRVKLSGASMSAPQVINAAGKLLALRPTLTTAQLVNLLTRGAQPFGEQKLRLLNPKASGALLDTP